MGETIHTLLNEIGMNNNTQLTQNNVPSFAQCGFEKCKHYFKNRFPHQSLIAAPQTARATFMFTVESFNARGHFLMNYVQCVIVKKMVPDTFVNALTLNAETSSKKHDKLFKTNSSPKT